MTKNREKTELGENGERETGVSPGGECMAQEKVNGKMMKRGSWGTNKWNGDNSKFE